MFCNTFRLSRHIQGCLSSRKIDNIFVSSPLLRSCAHISWNSKINHRIQQKRNDEGIGKELLNRTKFEFVQWPMLPPAHLTKHNAHAISSLLAVVRSFFAFCSQRMHSFSVLLPRYSAACVAYTLSRSD